MVFKRTLSKTFGDSVPYTSVESVLQGAKEFCAEKNMEKYVLNIRIPSKKYGLPFTDEVKVTYESNDKFEFSILEAESQDYLYNKGVERKHLSGEISQLKDVSGNPEQYGYIFFGFGDL